MKNRIDRREFVKRCTVAGAGLMVSPSLTPALGNTSLAEPYDLCSVVGDGYFDNTIKAVGALGGMNTFVRKGNAVGILINSPFGRPGTYTHPDIPLAVVKMCLDAGSKEIYTINDTSQRYWKRSERYEKMKSEIDSLKYSDAMTEIAIDKAMFLKKAEISDILLSCDVFINLPIIKDHEGTRFTCTMKNMMGACSSSTCRFFHYGGKFSLFGGAYANVQLLSQCIADVNLIRRPNLSVVDATEILATNGPSGPGDTKKPKEIIACTDGVAADMYAVRHLGLNPDELPIFAYARNHGMGPKSFKDIRVKQL